MKVELREIYTISEVEEIYKIPRQTLHSRLKNLVEGVDFRKLGIRMPILLTPDGVEKLVGYKC
jgi:Fic family protein